MESKHYVIVGGSHGIGLGIAHRLLDQKANVTVISRTKGELPDVPHLTHVVADVMTDPIHPEQFPEKINGLAYCPGSINLGPIRGIKLEAMQDDFQLNVLGAVKCLQAALPAMKAAESSAMVMFSTVAVAQGLPLHASVAASKGAVEALTRTFAAELAPKIRVNCISPALTATPLAERFLSTDEKKQAMGSRYPLKRVGEVKDLASIAEFLLTDQATWITGQVIGVDGGMSTLRV